MPSSFHRQPLSADSAGLAPVARRWYLRSVNSRWSFAASSPLHRLDSDPNLSWGSVLPTGGSAGQHKQPVILCRCVSGPHRWQTRRESCCTERETDAGARARAGNLFVSSPNFVPSLFHNTRDSPQLARADAKFLKGWTRIKFLECCPEMLLEKRNMSSPNTGTAADKRRQDSCLCCSSWHGLQTLKHARNRARWGCVSDSSEYFHCFT